MNIRFDDSLSALAKAIKENLGHDGLESGLALRDAKGQLCFFSPLPITKKKHADVSKKISQALGNYAREDRQLVTSNMPGFKSIFDERSLSITTEEGLLRLIDRRIIGADWLRIAAIERPSTPRCVFASVKGGVGRSTALAVSAAHFASLGKSILVIDLDLEAPGLGNMLLNESTMPEFGMVDLLVERGVEQLDTALLVDSIGPSHFSANKGKIDVVPAFGSRTNKNPHEALAKLSRAYLEDFSATGATISLLDKIRDIVERLAEQKPYDAVFIDARAGLHETTATALLGLSANVMLFGLDEPQTFTGFKLLLAHLNSNLSDENIRNNWLERLAFVQGKSENLTSDDYEDKCEDLLKEIGLVKRGSSRNTVSIPKGPFNNVPWLEDSEISDEELNEENYYSRTKTLKILNNENFKNFDPDKKASLLNHSSYHGTYQELLVAIERFIT